MSEQDLRDGLRTAVAGEPALSFDPDALIVRARQQIRRRRALAGAGVATAVVAVTAVAVPTVLGQSRGAVDGGAAAGAGGGPSCPRAEPASPVPTTITVSVPSGSRQTMIVVPRPSVTPTTALPASCTPSTTPTGPSGPPGPNQSPGTRPTVVPRFPWPPPNVVPPHYTAVQLKQRGTAMQDHLKTQFPKVVPDARQVLPRQFSGEAEGAVSDGQAYLEAFTSFTINGVRTAVDIYMSAPGSDGPDPVELCQTRCDTIAQPDGSHVLITTEHIDENLNGGIVISVLHYRTNGTIVRAAGYNYDPSGSGLISPQPTVPVTVEQLTALATDPALGI